MSTNLKRFGVAIAGMIVVLVLGFGVLLGLSWYGPGLVVALLGSGHSSDVMVGLEAPAFSLEPVGAGEDVRLSEHRGKTVVLEFWATWCEHCEATSKALAEAVEGRDDVVVIAINVREDENGAPAADHLKRYIETSGHDFVYVHGDDATLKSYESHMIPQIFAIDGDGVVRYAGAGAHERQHIDTALSRVR